MTVGGDGIDRAGNDAAARAALGMDARRSLDEGRERTSSATPAVDEVTGEVSGTGSGAGGSNPGEDFDDDHTAGSNTAR